MEATKKMYISEITVIALNSNIPLQSVSASKQDLHHGQRSSPQK